MIKGLITRLDGVMLVGGILGGLSGSFLAARGADHATPHVETGSQVADERPAAPREESEIPARARDAGAAPPHAVAVEPPRRGSAPGHP